MLEFPLLESTSGVAQLEGPEEVGSLLEVGANSVDLMNQIFHADDAVFAEILLNDGVISERNALFLDLAISTLVDELADTLEVWVSVGNPRVDNLEHLNGGLCDTDEDTVVDLKETQKLEDFAGLGSDLVDTVSRCKRRKQCNYKIRTYPLIRTTKTSFCSSGT